MADVLLKKPRRWPRRLAVFALFVIVSLGLVAWFAPTIIARSSYKDQLIADATKDLKGKLTVRELSLGWLDQVALHGVTLVDEEGKTAVEIESIFINKTLLELAKNPNDLGTITLSKPTVHLYCTPTTTNLETILAEYLKPSDKPAGKRPALSISIAEGTVELTEENSATKELLSNVGGTITIPADLAGKIEVALMLHKEEASSLGIDAGIAPEQLSMNLTTTMFAAAKVGPVLRRFVPGLAATGDLNGTLTLTKQGDDTTAQGSMLVNGLDLSGAPLQGDHVRFAEFALEPFKLTSQGGMIQTDGVKLRCDVGTLFIAGKTNPNESSQELLARAGVTVQAHVDVAKLAAMMPRLMHLREGITLQDGHATISIHSVLAGSEVAWQGSISTTDLRGTHDGKPLVWEKPLSVEFDVKLDAEKQPRFDKLEARSDFFALAGRGKLESFLVMVNLNLDRFSAKLGDFVNLDGVRFGGAASVTIKNDLAADGTFQATMNGKFVNAFFQDAQGRMVKEPQLTLDANANGQRDAGQVIRVDAATVTMLGGEERLSFVLKEPIADLNKVSSGKAALNINGELGRMLAWVRPWLSLPPDLILQGRGPIQTLLTLTEQGITVSDTTAHLQQVRFFGYGVDLNEPKLKLETATVVYDTNSVTVDVTKLIAHCDTFVYLAPKTTINLKNGIAVATAGDLTANLNRVQKTLRLQTNPTGTDAINGLAVGPIKVDYTGSLVSIDTALKIDGVIYGLPAKPTWMEPWVRLKMRGSYDLAKDAVTFEELRTERDGITLNTAGDVQALATKQNMNLKGNIAYDLAKLEPQLKTLLGASAKATGTGTKPFAVAGSLSDGPAGVQVAVGDQGIKTLNATAGLSWQQLLAYGFEMGPSELKADLDKGILKTNEIKANFGGGTVKLDPTVDFTKVGSPLTLKPGRILDKAKLTPAACADAFGFVLPALANSAAVDGIFSFDLEDNSIPLAAPETGTLKGKLFIHEANVSASPLLSQLIQLLGVEKATAVLAKEQTVGVKLDKGRVYHEGLMMTIGQTTIMMNGSVGMDRSLQMVIDMPVPPALVGKLLANNPKLRETLLKQRIKIPVGGTLAKPALDMKSADGTLQTMIRNAGKDFLNTAGGDLLDKLMKGAEKKKP